MDNSDTLLLLMGITGRVVLDGARYLFVPFATPHLVLPSFYDVVLQRVLSESSSAVILTYKDSAVNISTSPVTTVDGTAL